MTSFVAQSQLAQVARRALARMRDITRAGGVSAMAKVDATSGEIIDREARALFASLPAITPATTPDELVSLGLLRRVPEGWHDLADKPRYFRGRQVFVRTSVHHDVISPQQPVGIFDEDGRTDFTHRARLVDLIDDDFVVSLAGSQKRLRFARSDIYAWNEPCGLLSAGGTLSGIQVDYNEPRLKAYLCSAFIELSEAISSLDFTGDGETLQAQQCDILYALGSMVRMEYAGKGSGHAGTSAASLIDGGQGVCFVQRAVAAGLLQPFAKIAGFELQVAVGRTLKLGVPHGFLVLTLVPSMSRYVCDPAWSEPLTELPVAFFGPNWGHDRRLAGFEGEQQLLVRSSALDFGVKHQQADN